MMTEMIFGLIGGLGFFFFGMQTMSEGLKKIAGERLKAILHTVTKNRISGVLVGTFVTLLIQSSSATTVMTVGFVNAGLLGLKQAITVVMGANIGTTFTAWLVSSMSIFKITKYALPAIGLGFFIMTFGGRQKRKNIGRAILGFGLLFIGLSFMKDAFEPLKNTQWLHDVFVTFSAQPLLGILAGIIFTILLQSSSATIAIVQVLAFNGVISFDAAIPIILGDNIGTTITAQMAAIGSNINARRTAMSHSLFNIFGVCYMLYFVQIGMFEKFIDLIIPGTITANNIMFYIAVAHSTFNVINTLVFLPFVGFLEKASVWLVPERGEPVDYGTQYLEKHLLDTPSLAFEQIHKENVYMLSVARKAVNKAMDCFVNNHIKDINKVMEYETATDNLQSEITQYMVDLSQRNLLKEESNELPVLIHNVNDIERIGDHAQNLAELTKRKVDEALPFSDQAMQEIGLIWTEVSAMFDEAADALTNHNSNAAQKMLDREKIINEYQYRFKQSHVSRLNNGACNLNSGFIFLELIDNLEKVADRLTNIAQSVIGKMQWKPNKKKSGATQSA